MPISASDYQVNVFALNKRQQALRCAYVSQRLQSLGGYINPMPSEKARYVI
jgi:hypothetical protein